MKLTSPTISGSGSGRCRAAGRVAHGIGADLSVASVSKDGRHRPQQVAPTGDKSFGALQNVARRKTVGMENVL
jgi:hypothetical protein